MDSADKEEIQATAVLGRMLARHCELLTNAAANRTIMPEAKLKFCPRIMLPLSPSSVPPVFGLSSVCQVRTLNQQSGDPEITARPKENARDKMNSSRAFR